MSGKIPDYQTAAFLMAAVIRGMTTAETAALTEAMRDSGDCWDLSDLAPVVDKHSTGGVGDKVTLVLAPLVAAAGGRVGMMSGRGLGHTGGTLDKLAAIPGFPDGPRSAAGQESARDRGHGPVSADRLGRSGRQDALRPARRDGDGRVPGPDRRLDPVEEARLRDTHGIVFDVKTGNGAFMKTIEDSRALGRSLVDTSRAAGRQATGWITDMSRPLGRAVGNALEAEESILVLRNEGPDGSREICLLMGVDMLRFAEPSLSESEARERLAKAIASGQAARVLEKSIEFQGGDPKVVQDPSRLPQPKQKIPALAARSGFVRSIQTEKMGFLSIDIGCGRAKREDTIDFAAGFLVEKTVGDKVEKGEPLVVVCLGDRPLPREGFVAEIAALYEIGDTPGTPAPLAVERL